MLFWVALDPLGSMSILRKEQRRVTGTQHGRRVGDRLIPTYLCPFECPRISGCSTP
jgi:hypothetical protein